MMTNGEKQGYLGNLREKSPQELQELLKRQLHMKSNVNLKVLPDKGEKILKKIKEIQQILDEQNLDPVFDTSSLFEKLALQADQALKDRTTNGEMKQEEEEEEEGEDRLKHVVNQQSNDTVYLNSYERVIRNAEKRPHKAKFHPNKTVHTHHIDELAKQMDLAKLHDEAAKKDYIRNFDPTIGHIPKNKANKASTSAPSSSNTSKPQRTRNTPAPSKSPKAAVKREDVPHEARPVICHKTLLQRGKPEDSRLKHWYDESLMERLSDRKGHASILISIDESVKLEKEQKDKQDEIQGRIAAQRLAERLHIRMEAFQPDSTEHLSHREPAQYNDDDRCMEEVDSDDEQEVMDYPD